MKTWWILKKELIDGLRDQRAMLLALSFALLGPLIIVASVNTNAKAARDTSLAPFALCGAGRAPELVAHLVASGLTVAEQAEICLDIPADYAERQAAGRTAHVRVIADLAATGFTTSRLEREITNYSRGLAAKRLMARGVAPQVITPLTVDMQSTNRVSRSAAMFGNAFIIYIVFAPFIIVVAMAADTTAGERERRSLETLLSHSVQPLELILGKFLALAVVNMAGTALCVLLSLVLLERSAIAEVGLRVATDWATGLTVWLWLVPLCMLVAAVQLTAGLLARTAKEAQQTLAVLSLLPLAVGLAQHGRPAMQAGAWPLGWELQALAGPLLSSTTDVAAFPVVAAVEIGIAALLLFTAAWHLRSERVLG